MTGRWDPGHPEWTEAPHVEPAVEEFADGFRVDDRLLVHGVLRGGLRRIGLDAIGATAVHELDQLDRRSCYVKSEQRTILAR